MNSIPVEAQPFAIAAALLVIGVIILFIRLLLVSRAHAVLKRSRDDLEVHLLRAQRDLASARDDAAEWRSQLQQQSDSYRSLSAGQLTAAEARFSRLQNQFDDYSKASDKTQLELRTQLDVLRGMCAELPYAKARTLELERSLGERVAQAETEALPLLPLPALSDETALSNEPALSDEPTLNGHEPPSFEEPVSSNGTHAAQVDDARLIELEAELARSSQRNASLQRELLTLRARSNRASVVPNKVKRARG